jgi:hypothetical protein
MGGPKFWKALKRPTGREGAHAGMRRDSRAATLGVSSEGLSKTQFPREGGRKGGRGEGREEGREGGEEETGEQEGRY